MTRRAPALLPAALLAAFVLTCGLHAQDAAWWNPAWSQRQKLTLDTGSSAAAVTEDAGGATVLVRLFDGNFHF
ncbi:MAG: DUF2341 domain-containing protein, partial [Verrucomicrobiota bacterium]